MRPQDAFPFAADFRQALEGFWGAKRISVLRRRRSRLVAGRMPRV